MKKMLQTFGAPVVPEEKHKNAIRRRLSPGPKCVRRSPFTRCLSRAALMTWSSVRSRVPPFEDPMTITSMRAPMFTSAVWIFFTETG